MITSTDVHQATLKASALGYLMMAEKCQYLAVQRFGEYKNKMYTVKISIKNNHYEITFGNPNTS